MDYKKKYLKYRKKYIDLKLKGGNIPLEKTPLYKDTVFPLSNEQEKLLYDFILVKCCIDHFDQTNHEKFLKQTQCFIDEYKKYYISIQIYLIEAYIYKHHNENNQDMITKMINFLNDLKNQKGGWVNTLTKSAINIVNDVTVDVTKKAFDNTHNLATTAFDNTQHLAKKVITNTHHLTTESVNAVSKVVNYSTDTLDTLVRNVVRPITEIKFSSNNIKSLKELIKSLIYSIHDKLLEIYHSDKKLKNEKQIERSYDLFKYMSTHAKTNYIKNIINKLIKIYDLQKEINILVEKINEIKSNKEIEKYL